MAAATLQGEITQLSTGSEGSPLTWQAPAWLSNLSYSPDGARLGGVDLATFTVYIFSLDGIVQQKLEWTSSASPNLYGAFFSPDWSRIAWAARSAVQIMEIPSSEQGPLLNHEDYVSAVQWSPDSQVLATAAAQNTGGGSIPIVILWNPANGQILKTFVQQFAVQSLSFSPDSRKLAVMDVNGDLQVFSIEP